MTTSNPDHFAIVIGINSYPQLPPPLPAAADDAARFARWLIEVGGLDEKHIAIITSRHPNDFHDPKPVHRQVTLALERFGVSAALENPKKIGRRLYFYFSGHAVGADFSDVSMFMADVSLRRLKQNIGLRPYRIFLHATGFFEEAIFILDCCRDHERGAEAQGVELTTQPPKVPLQIMKDFVAMAAPWGSKAFEAPVDGLRRSGLLTEALLEGIGLDGPPKAIDPQGRVKTNLLAAYLKARVPQLAQGAQVDQTPEAEAKVPIVLATFPLDPAKAVTLTIRWQPELPLGTLIIVMKLLDGTDDEVDRHEMTAAVQSFVIALRAGFTYEAHHSTLGLSRQVDLRGAADGEARAIDFPF